MIIEDKVEDFKDRYNFRRHEPVEFCKNCKFSDYITDFSGNNHFQCWVGDLIVGSEDVCNCFRLDRNK